MNLINRARWWAIRALGGGIQTPAFMREGFEYGRYHPEIPDYSLARNQAELYRCLSWVYTATETVSSTALDTEFSVKQRVQQRKEDIENHPFEMLLDNPNPLNSKAEFLGATFAYHKLAGNAYWWLNRPAPDAPPSEMWIIPPSQLIPVPDEKLYLRGYLYDPGDGTAEIPLDVWEICHFKTFNPNNRFVGMSAVEALATTAVGDLAMQKWNTNYFAKDHAKPPGALAFADPIGNADWMRLQKEAQDQYGGTNRKLMMLRNAGRGGVQWLQFGISQRDMEFLEGRTFNREEIFGAMAPGLASLLAVNATEANSVAGMATFMKMAVRPQHVAVAAKITKAILPSYGKNLICEFDDVRMADRQMELQEMQMAARVMTHAEFRDKYFQLPAFGDDRDKAIVDGLPKPGSEVAMLPQGAGRPQEHNPKESDTRPPDARGETTNGKSPDRHPENGAKKSAAQIEDEEPDEIAVDLDRWRRKAIKRFKQKGDGLVGFESAYIPTALKAAIEVALQSADSAEAVHLAFQDALAWESYP